MKDGVKTVGRRKPASGGIAAAANLLELAVDLRKGKPFIPRGVWRFKSFEEKDAWTLKMLTR